ncbi:MAG: nuclear transport factor 2 family protein [Corynebacteriales bacterium]|nr:nuclear transport factor 2 family protein [Mycobacteriales bacterium]
MSNETSTARDVTAAIDRWEIAEVCVRMAWHADQREWDKLTRVFADKVELDYTSLNGGEPVTLTPDQIATGWSSVLGTFDATQHLTGNHLVTLDGDQAVCTASFQATHRLHSTVGSGLWTLGGTYHFDLIRTDAGWRISRVVMKATWGDGNQELLTRASQ